jgi:hypothetical protein
MKVECVTVLCVCVWTQVHIQKRHQNRTWNPSTLDMTQFVLRSWRSESCTEYWLWCVVLCVGADRTVDVSTRRLGSECSCPWHVWRDVRTRVKCVKDVWCIGGSCEHLVRQQTYSRGLSCYITFYSICDEGRMCDGFVCVCVDTSPHTETTPKPDLKPIHTWYDTICFEELEEWVLDRVLTLMCCFVCVCGPYGWRLDSTFREWVFLPLTSVKRCQDECELCEGWVVYRGLLFTSC